MRSARSATLAAMKRLGIPLLIVPVAAIALVAGGRALAAGGTPLWVLQQNQRAADEYKRQRAERVPAIPMPARTPDLAIPTPVRLDPDAVVPPAAPR